MSGPVTITPLGPISATAQRYIESALSTLAPDDVAASVLAVHVENGKPQLEAAFAYQGEHGWTVAAYVVTDFREDLAAGAYIRKTWKRAPETVTERLAREAGPFNGPRENRED